jgi:ribonuclease III
MPALLLKDMKSRSIKDFLNLIGYEADDIVHIKTALTHSSYANTSKDGVRKNEKYEFLGDSVLGFVTTDHIFIKYPDLAEGELTRLRAAIVCEQNLSLCAKKIDLGKYLLLGRGEELSGGHEKPSILSDSLEALIGGIYLDKGITKAQEFIRKHIIEPFFLTENGFDKKDYKSLLQEIIQQKGMADIDYRITGCEGPDHDKTFYIDLYVNGELSGNGKGKSKKEAEQMAAKKAYIKKKEES